MFERADVNGGIRARRAPERGLIDENDAAQVFGAGETGGHIVRFRGVSGIFSFVGDGGFVFKTGFEERMQDVADERAFAGAAHARHANETAEWNLRGELAQVVKRRSG